MLRGRARAGRACHLVGYPLWAVLARAGRRSIEPPYVIGSLAMIYGYLRARIRREPRTAPPDVTAHLRRTLRQRLFLETRTLSDVDVVVVAYRSGDHLRRAVEGLAGTAGVHVQYVFGMHGGHTGRIFEALKGYQNSIRTFLLRGGVPRRCHGGSLCPPER